MRSIAGLDYDEILAAEGYPDGSETPVYVSGSIVTSYANPWSDVDVYVLSDRGTIGAFAIPEGAGVVSQHFVRDRRVDFEFWPPATVAELAARLDRLDLADADNVPRSRFSYQEECFIHRLRVGVPLLNEPQLAAWRERFDFAKLSAYQSQEAIRALDGVYEDACGMLDGGAFDVAMLSARQLVGLSVDAYVHKHGSTDPTVKWRPRQLEAVDDGSAFHHEVAGTYWSLEFPDEVGSDSSPERRRAYVERCLDFSRRLTSWVQS